MAIVYDGFGNPHADYRTENAATAAAKTASDKTNRYSAVNRAPVVARPTRAQYGTPSREGIDTTEGQMSAFLADYQNPRGSARFSDLLGQASSSLARGREESIRQAQEIAARRGYVGGFSGEADRATRAYEQNRARIGFDAATSIAKDSAGLYDTAAGRYAQLIASYNDQLSAGDRAYGGAVEDANARRASVVQSFRDQQEAQRQYELTLAENQRQYDSGLGEKSREFDVTTGETKRQFDTTTAEGKRQFDAQDKLSRDQLAAAIRDQDLDRALALAKELGLDPRLLMGRFGMAGMGGVPGSAVMGTVRPTAR